MKLIYCLFALIFAFVSSSDESSSFVVGGRDATIEEFPYMAGVLNFGQPSCGGSIVNSRSVLTAAHCIIVNSAALVSVSVGSSRRQGQGGVTHRAIRIFIHPEYEYVATPVFKLQNDIAIIRTLTRIMFGSTVQPIPIGTANVQPASQVILTGWGLLGDSSIRDRADQMQQLDMVAIPNLVCALMHVGTEAEGVVSDEKICVTAAGNAGGCGGDSGGPIAWMGSVVGIASWTVRPCGSHPTVFIRVSHHLPWIRQHL